ncbi:MAG: thiamine-phosphate kinase [Frankiaceae bacterium]|jgi:thiamine-monophosphate kinase|nr:thiamine-phosphate kinase [Frankiaceae bacterium]
MKLAGRGLEARDRTAFHDQGPGGGVITVADEGEFGLISRLTAGIVRTDDVLLGPGDDAAVTRAGDGRVVSSTDLMVEGVHFRRDWSTANDVGRKAAAANLADIAAMGATATAILVGLATPPDLPGEWASGLMDGLREECGQVGAAVVGGDVVRSPTLMISIAVLGDLQGRAPVLRSGARPGEIVALAGRVGWADAGLAVLGRGFRSPVQVVTAHRRPEPPYAEGPRAAELGATAMIDISDGLVADAGHIAAASSVRINLRSAALSLPSRLREVAAALNIDPMTWLLSGGDDHALLATFPPILADRLGPAWTVIGEVSPGDGVRVDGRSWRGPGGAEHFR